MSEQILFYKSVEPWGFLNNFTKARMFVFGRWWDNVEQPYQASKCVDPEDYKRICQSMSPREARNMGQTVKMIPQWDEFKDDVMYQCVFAKFVQNHDLLMRLLHTGFAEIIEDSPIDAYWGWGKDHTGRNQLGKTLMRVREELKGFDLRDQEQ